MDPFTYGAFDLVGFSADQIVEQGDDYCYAQYFTLTLKIPSPTGEEDLKIKEYYAACIIRMCGFGPDENHESMIYEP